MNRFFLLILFLVYNMHLCLYALIDSQTVVNQVQVKQIVLGECKDKPLNDRYEIFSCDKYSRSLFNITHKDVLVNSSSNNINVEVTFSNDTVFIYETEVETSNRSTVKCLRDLSYQIEISDFEEYDIFLVLISEISSKSYQVFFACNSNDYPVTEKLNYQYKPFIMDGTCEWVIQSFYADGYREIISNEDTLITGKTYKKIFTIRCKPPYLKKYAGAIREDNRQIFFIDAYKWGADEDEIKPEKILYDFNLTKGDQFECLGGYPITDLEILNFEVSHVDTILLEGIARRKYYFRPYSSETWTEGIGGEYILTYPFPFLMTGFNSMLGGVWHNGKALYCNGGCTCDEITSITDHDYVPNFHILNNPVENGLLQINVHASDFSKLDLYSFDGRLVVSEKITIDKEILEIPLLNLVSGNYIVILSRPDGRRESAKIVVL